ncbi:hypothetical protein [Nostoc linckia]|nr:hypothetical protein [Nostoc linckia]
MAVREGANDAENAEFWKATPNGKLEMCITNPNAKNSFQPGVYYWLDFVLIPDNQPSIDQSIDNLDSLDKEILFQMIKHLNDKITELETVNTSQRDQLSRRVQELEQFQCECETAQEYERDRS